MDGTQVNTNFLDVVNDMSDGTTDLSIGTLVVAGAGTFNGAVTLGNSSSDALTVTGSISSTIPYATNATYNIGAATLAPLSIYLGNGTKSTRIIAGTVGTSWTFTLPNDVPAITGQGMIFNTSGTAEFRYADKFTASKTTDYTATGDETIIPCAPAASMTVTLPAASTMTGKSLTIIKTDTDIAKTVTIDANASETINGATTFVMYTQYESVTIKCDGSNWHVTDHYASTPWNDAGAITITGTTSNPTKGNSPTRDKFFWRRDGNTLHGRMEFQNSTATGSAAGSGDYIFQAVPTGITIDTTVLTVYATAIGTGSNPALNVIGFGSVYDGTPSSNQGGVFVHSTTGVRVYVDNATNAGCISSGFYALTSATRVYAINYSVPITGWAA